MNEDMQEPEENEEHAERPANQHIYYYMVRYSAMSALATFTSSIEDLRSGERVIVQTERGVEAAEVLSRFEDVQKLPTNTPFSKILRRMTREDEIEEQRIETVCVPEEMRFCREKIEETKIPMKLTFVEHLFGSDRLIFYFLSEGRVDFRDLVKELAQTFQTRIELKQIGVRDEARILADYEHCGQPLCCRTFIRKLQPVSMKMAKNQKATLDPSKISGACGRLMCCLRYEDKVYSELNKTIPKKGSTVEAGEIRGQVVDSDVLQQYVTVVREDSNVRTRVNVADITATFGRGQRTQKPKCAGCPSDERRSDSRRPSTKGPDTEETPAAPPDAKSDGDSNTQGDSTKPPSSKRRRRRRSRRKSGNDPTGAAGQGAAGTEQK